MKNFDVIIIGAGPAGLGSAYNLAKKGIKVLVIEERQLGKTDKTWLTFLSVLKKYNLEENIVNRIDTLTFRSYLGGVYHLDGEITATIDEKKALKNLASQAVSNGAKINTRESFVNYKYLQGIIAINTSKETYGAKLMIDAMGAESHILGSLGFSNPKVNMGCYACEVQGLKIPDRHKVIIYDSFFPGNDYFWVVPQTNARAIVGIFSFKTLNQITLVTAKRRLQKYMEVNKLNGRIVGIKKGNIPLGPQKYCSAERIISIGDSANTALPSSGFSFAACLKDSEILADFAEEYLDNKKEISEYKADLLSTKLPGIEIHCLISDLVVNFTDPLLNKAIAGMEGQNKKFIQQFLTGDDMGIGFTTQAVKSILSIFNFNEIKRRQFSINNPAR